MSASGLSTALKEQLSCSICLNVFTEPKTLKCLHSFCLPCLKELALKTPPNIPLRCPDCQADIRLQAGDSFDDFPNSFYFNRLLELLNIQEPQQTTANCGSCARNQPLTSFCFDCGQFLCGECVNAHNLVGALKGHRRVALKQLKDKDVHDFLERPDSCSIEYHDQEKLKYYCEDCKTCICQHCALVEHKSHQYVHIKKAGNQCKAAMTEAVNKVKAKIPFVQDAIKKAEESFVMTEQQIRAASLQVEEQVEHFILLFRQHKTEIISELESIEQSEKCRYETKRSDLETQLAQLKSGVEFVDAAVGRNLANEIINTHDSVIKRCTELAAEDERGNEGKQIKIKYEASKEFVVTTTQVTPGRVLVTGLVDPSCSTIELRQASVGKQAEFVVITRDSQGKVCSYGGDCVEVTIKSSTGEAVESTVLDQKNGHYTVQYTPRNVGNCEVTVQITGKAAAGSPFEVRVREKKFKPLKTFGSAGSGAGQLYGPRGVAVNSRGEVAVTDSSNHRIQLFTSDGLHLRTIGSEGSAKGEVNFPSGVAFDHQDRLIVADYNNNRIQILTTEGQCVKTFGEEELENPLGVYVTKEGNIAVCSQGEKEKQGVKVFTQDGVLITQFHDSKRNGYPYDVTFNNNKFFVSYANDHGVSVFNREGILLHSFGERGQRGGQFNCPWGVAIDKSNRVLVCDFKNHRIQAFTTEGQVLQKIGSKGTALGQFSQPVGITISPSGHVYVSENLEHRVQILSYE